jgi:hypothetical protein
MSSSNKITLLSDFVAGVYLSETQNPIPHLPLHTVYVYTYLLHREGGGGRGEELNQRERERVHKAGSKIPT